MSARALFQGLSRGRNGHGINHLLVILFLDKRYGFQHCRKFPHENSRPIPERVWCYQQHKHKRLFTLKHLRTTTSFTICHKTLRKSTVTTLMFFYHKQSKTISPTKSGLPVSQSKPSFKQASLLQIGSQNAFPKRLAQ